MKSNILSNYGGAKELQIQYSQILTLTTFMLHPLQRQLVYLTTAFQIFFLPYSYLVILILPSDHANSWFSIYWNSGSLNCWWKRNQDMLWRIMHARWPWAGTQLLPCLLQQIETGSTHSKLTHDCKESLDGLTSPALIQQEWNSSYIPTGGTAGSVMYHWVILWKYQLRFLCWSLQYRPSNMSCPAVRRAPQLCHTSFEAACWICLVLGCFVVVVRYNAAHATMGSHLTT